MARFGTYHVDTSNPFRLVANLVEGADGLEQRISGTLADTFVVVVEEFNELQGALLDVRQEVSLRGGEHGADGISSNLLLDSNSTVDIEQLVQVEILEFDGWVAVGVYLTADVDRVGGRRTGGEGLGSAGNELRALLLALLGLLAALDQSGDNLRQIRGELFTKDLSHDAEEEEAALPESWAAHFEAGECLGHHVGEVRPEVLLADSLSEGSNSVHRDSAELCLFTLLCEGQEVGQNGDGLLEVGNEPLLGCVSGAADGSGDDSLHRKRGSLKQTGELLHDELEILVDVFVKNLEKGIQRSACSLLGDGVVDEGHDTLKLHLSMHIFWQVNQSDLRA